VDPLLLNPPALVEKLRVSPARETLLLKPGEAAEELRVGVATIYRLISRRAIPAVRVGASWRVPRGALREWIAAKTELPDLQHGRELAGERSR
jgi:excisionase family DNA binding protein